MGRAIALLVLGLLALGSVIAFLLASQRIAVGEKRIAAGDHRIDKGQDRLDAGKDRLVGGRKKLSAGKKKYDEAHENPALFLSDTLFQGGAGFQKARRQIAVGERKIDQGQEKIAAEEERLDLGEQRLTLGKDELKAGKNVRLAFGLGALVFSALSMAFGLRWDRALSRARARASKTS